jgi:lysophospholipase L1-like esterase
MQSERASIQSDKNNPNVRKQRLLGNFLLLGCSVLVGLFIGELLLRHYYPIGEAILQLDQRYLHRFRPNSRQIYRFSVANGGKKVLTVINAEGRRGDLVSRRRPHVLVYGDSYISSSFTQVSDTFVSQLEQRLKGDHSLGPQVVNCGVSGYGPDQESLVLEDEIDTLKPQLVIVSIYSGNDFGDLIRDKIYKLDDQLQLEDNHYTIDPSLVSAFAASEQLPRLYSVRLLQNVWERTRAHFAQTQAHRDSQTGKDYMDVWLRESRVEYEDYIINGDNSVHNLLEDHYDADVSLDPNSESARYKRLLMDRVIEKMQKVTAARSIPMILVIIPAPFDIVDNYAVTVDTHKYPEYRRSGLTDIIEQIALQHRLPYVNLFTPFREHGAGSLYYVEDNDHWNPEGQKLAAGLVADYIMQRHVLDASTGAR